MNKLKINPALAALIIIATSFAGWGYALIVILLTLIFCEIDEKNKNIIIKVLSFCIGIYLVNTVWDLIYDGAKYILDSGESIIEIINSPLALINSIFDTTLMINKAKYELYISSPILNIFEIINRLIVFFIALSKFTFIISILTSKPQKENFIVKKTNKYIEKIISFINSYSLNQQESNFQQSNINQQNIQQSVQNQTSNITQ